MRQCDYPLCNNCEKKRREEIKEIEKGRNSSSSPSEVPNTGETDLARLFAPLTTSSTKSDKPKLNPQKTETPKSHEAATNFPIDSTSSASVCCVSSTCNVSDDSSQISTCKCSVCLMEYHITCVGLKKRPGQKTNWSCPKCKIDTNLAIKKLSQTILLLQETVNKLTSNQQRLDEQQNALRNENTDLKLQVSSMKETIAKLSTHQGANSDSIPEGVSKTLIIGDSMLREISESSVSNAKIKCISGATVKDISQEINKMSDELSTFKNIIVHSGTNDVSKGTNIQTMTDTMEAIITSVMVKSPTSEVHISAICPRSCKTKEAEEYNQSLKELSTRLTCGYIDIRPKVTYQDGTIDSSKYADSIHLNSNGTQILINAFVAAVPNLQPTDENRLYSTVVKSRRGKMTDTRTDNQSTRKSTNNKAPRSTHYRPSEEIDTRQKSDRADHRDERRSRTARFDRRIDHQRYRATDFNSDCHDYRITEYAGCWKCGLYNHNAKTCFYKSKLQCRSCNLFGHKARYCTEN